MLELIILGHLQLVAKCKNELGESIWCHNQLLHNKILADISRDYSTDSFYQVLRRFSSIRGWPKMIYSDNGTQLKSASKELQKAVKNIDKGTLLSYNAEHGTEWRFCPPDAPWMNGVTESLVKSIKKALPISIGEQIMEFSVLQTVMFECAELVNGRPIGRHPTSIDDDKYMCPNDLLLGRYSNRVPQRPFHEDCNAKKKIGFIQKTAECFWKMDT